MQRVFFVGVDGARAGTFAAALPDALRAWTRDISEQRALFHVPAAAARDAAAIVARAREAGLDAFHSRELTGLARDDLRDDLVFAFYAPIVRTAHLAPHQYLVTATCPSCGSAYERLRRDGPRPTLTLTEPPDLPIFRAPEGSGTVIAREFARDLAAAGLLDGAALHPLTTRGRTLAWFLLVGSACLGERVAYDAPVCFACGRQLGPGSVPLWYPLYRRPAQPADVAFVPRYGEQQPFVSGRLARAVFDRLGGFGTLEARLARPHLNLVPAGWYPDAEADALAPDLDALSSAATSAPPRAAAAEGGPAS